MRISKGFGLAGLVLAAAAAVVSPGCGKESGNSNGNNSTYGETKDYISLMSLQGFNYERQCRKSQDWARATRKVANLANSYDGIIYTQYDVGKLKIKADKRVDGHEHMLNDVETKGFSDRDLANWYSIDQSSPKTKEERIEIAQRRLNSARKYRKTLDGYRQLTREILYELRGKRIFFDGMVGNNSRRYFGEARIMRESLLVFPDGWGVEGAGGDDSFYFVQQSVPPKQNSIYWDIDGYAMHMKDEREEFKVTTGIYKQICFGGDLGLIKEVPVEELLSNIKRTYD